jgi:hypothetical protein
MKRIATTVIIGLALLLPGAALASGSSTCQSYNPQLCSVASNSAAQNSGTGTNSNGSPTTASASASTLPFTGLDVVLLAVGGGTLLGAGLVVRRLSRTSD